MVTCWACGGCGVDEGGEVPVLCLACEGKGSLSWKRVEWLGMASRYPLADRILAAATDRTGLGT